jgi:hypothetical protein
VLDNTNSVKKCKKNINALLTSKRSYSTKFSLFFPEEKAKSLKHFVCLRQASPGENDHEKRNVLSNPIGKDQVPLVHSGIWSSGHVSLFICAVFQKDRAWLGILPIFISAVDPDPQ